MNSLVGFALVYCVIIAVVGGGAAVQRYRRTPLIRTPFAQRCCQAMLLLAIPGIAAIVTYISYTDYSSRTESLSASSSLGTNKEESRPPFAMALADGAITMFGILVLPTPHYAGLGRLLRLSYERLVWIHLVSALLMITLMTGHWIVMARVSGTGALILTSSIVAAVPALFRHWKYTIFRYSHIAGILAFVFLILHAARSLIMLVPGLALYGLDMYQRFLWFRRANAKIQSLHFNIKNDVIELVVSWSSVVDSVGGKKSLLPPQPAQFGLIVIPEISLVPHPFSVALCSPADDAVRGTDDDASNDSSSQHVATFYIRKTHDASWTGQLASLSLSRSSPNPSWPAIHITGFHGELMIPMAACTHVVLVAGGIGVTPIIHILDCMLHRPVAHVRSVSVIWTSRNAEDLHHLGSLIEDRATRIADAARTPSHYAQNPSISAFHTQLEFFCTTTPAPRDENPVVTTTPPQLMTSSGEREMHDVPRDDDPSPLLSSRRFTIVTGRPVWNNVMFNVAQRVGHHTTADANSERVGCFLCGPPSMMSAASAEAHRMKFLVHEEAFEI